MYIMLIVETLARVFEGCQGLHILLIVKTF